MVYILCFLILCFIVLMFLFYLLVKKIIPYYRYSLILRNTIKLENIVREIITKACIISIITNKENTPDDEEKEKRIIENAMAITADVLLQHNIEPKNYDLSALVKVEIFRINLKIK